MKRKKRIKGQTKPLTGPISAMVPRNIRRYIIDTARANGKSISWVVNALLKQGIDYGENALKNGLFEKSGGGDVR